MLFGFRMRSLRREIAKATDYTTLLGLAVRARNMELSELEANALHKAYADIETKLTTFTAVEMRRICDGITRKPGSAHTIALLAQQIIEESRTWQDALLVWRWIPTVSFRMGNEGIVNLMLQARNRLETLLPTPDEVGENPLGIWRACNETGIWSPTRTAALGAALDTTQRLLPLLQVVNAVRFGHRSLTERQTAYRTAEAHCLKIIEGGDQAVIARAVKHCPTDAVRAAAIARLMELDEERSSP
ncbi:hypothetical protein GVX82_01270 [Patescibacteria group bacterium]|jgi:hypothetical protein|nr:hypothetical protein [Patescibacteria group bacterium]